MSCCPATSALFLVMGPAPLYMGREAMIDTKPFTDEQWWKMCDVNLHMPEPLGRADKSRPFVYDRKWGLFHCPPGHHPAAMGLLLAFHHGLLCRLDVAEKLGVDVPYGAADYYLEHTPG